MRVLRLFLRSSFLRQNAVVFVGSVLVGVANYAYYPILGRLLHPKPFGEVQALVSLFVQLMLFLTVLGQVTVNIVSNYTDDERKQRVVFELEKFAFLLSIGIMVVLAALSFKLKTFFQFDSVWPFVLLLLALIASVPGAFRGAYLRAHKRFLDMSMAQLIGSVGKIIFSVVLVLLGFKSSGAMGGLIVAQLLTFIYAARQARKIGFHRPERTKNTWLPDVRLLRPELKYMLLVFVVSLTTAALSSIDVFVVKHYFDPRVAGEYAAISTVAKIIFFLTGSVSQVLLPSVTLRIPRQENRVFLLKSLGLVVAAGGVAVLMFSAFSRSIVRVLMGTTYIAQASLLPRLSFAMFLLSVVGLIASYYLALRRYSIGYIVSVGTLLVVWLMVLRHGSLSVVVSNLIYGSGAILGLFIIWRLAMHFTQKKTSEL